jgi:hypothetical protein
MEDAATVQSLSLDNNRTHEKLVINGNGTAPTNTNLEDYVTISRYPMGATEEWIKEMTKDIEEYLLSIGEDLERTICVDMDFNLDISPVH